MGWPSVPNSCYLLWLYKDVDFTRSISLNRYHKILTFFLVLCSMSCVVIAVFLPYGLNINGTLEEYLVMSAYAFASQEQDLINNSQTILRPFSLPMALFSYSLTPYSYFGVNIVNYSLIVVKGVILFYILVRLKFLRSAALATAILFTIYPTNATSLRLIIVVQAATVTFLLGILLLLRLNSKWRWPECILMVVFLATTMLMYEMTFVLILFIPLLLVLLNQINNSVIRLSLIWYSVFALVGMRWLYFYIALKDSYQQSIISGVDNHPFILLTKLREIYQWNLAGVWYRSLAHTYNAVILYCLIATLISAFFFLLFLKLSPKDAKPLQRQQFLQLAIALVVIALGYAVFLLTNVRDLYDRVFGLSSIGAASFLVCLSQFLSAYLGKYRYISFSFLVAVLIFLSLVTAMRLRENDVLTAFQQQSVVADIVEEIPDVNVSGPTIVVFDKTGNLVSSLFLRRVIEGPLQILYDDPNLRAFLCYPQISYGWQDETCTLGVDNIFYQARTISYLSSYDNVIAFMYHEDGVMRLLLEIPRELTNGIIIDGYEPLALICGTCPYPSRVRSYFTSFPFVSRLRTEPQLKDLLSFMNQP
jgi:hypothetical protein